jgi:hypothetical protein
MMFCGLPVIVAVDPIRRHRHGQQVGHRPASQRERQLQHERSQHQADRVVHQEGGKNARGRDDPAEQDQRPPGVRDHPGIDDGEKARKPQVGDDDHHAKQQRDGIEVHRLVGILERQGARCDHEPGADQGDAGPVDAQAGYPAEREREIASGKDDAGRKAPTLPADSIAGRKQSRRQGGRDGYHDH